MTDETNPPVHEGATPSLSAEGGVELGRVLRRYAEAIAKSQGKTLEEWVLAVLAEKAATDMSALEEWRLTAAEHAKLLRVLSAPAVVTPPLEQAKSTAETLLGAAPPIVTPALERTTAEAETASWGGPAVADLRRQLLAKFDDRAQARAELFAAIQAALPHLEELLATMRSHWHAPDLFYRFYHQSYKVYHANEDTAEMVRELQALAPGRQLNEWFLAIVADAAGRKFEPDVNSQWVEATGPVIEAFLHAKMFLELVVQEGRGPAPQPGHSLSSGWAAVLHLYGLRY